jgi:predicted RNA-binding protein with PIN domain
MSLHFLLDAYNIIYQLPELSRGNLEEQRDKLIAFVDAKRPQGSPKNAVTIVFDGRPGNSRPRASVSAKVIFSLDESADERILRLVDEAANRKSVIVVTNDRAVQYAARALGAKVIEAVAFMGKGLERPSKAAGNAKGKQNRQDPPKEISLTLESQINEELRSVWLKEKK